MNINLEDLKFGDKFITRDGRMAIYCGKLPEYNDYYYFCVHAIDSYFIHNDEKFPATVIAYSKDLHPYSNGNGNKAYYNKLEIVKQYIQGEILKYTAVFEYPDGTIDTVEVEAESQADAQDKAIEILRNVPYPGTKMICCKQKREAAE